MCTSKNAGMRVIKTGYLTLVAYIELTRVEIIYNGLSGCEKAF